MDINSLMSAQLASLQHTLQLSLINQTMINEAASVDQLLENLPVQQTDAPHPYKGLHIDLSV